MSIRPVAYEFFAGGGLAGIGLSGDFDIGFANDIDPIKTAAFAANHPQVPLHQGDVWELEPDDLHGRPDLCWASSPCQDVSLLTFSRSIPLPFPCQRSSVTASVRRRWRRTVGMRGRPRRCPTPASTVRS